MIRGEPRSGPAMRVLSGSANQALAGRLAAHLGAEKVDVERRRFPDGEAYVRLLSPVRGEHVVVVQSTHPDPNLVELFLLLDAARRNGAARVSCVVPYYAYARQDKVFKEGEPISSLAFSTALEGFFDDFVTVDPHKTTILEHFSKPSRSVSAAELLADHLKTARIDAILAPDVGALRSSTLIADRLGVSVDHLEKKRISGTQVTIKPKTLDVQGRSVAIVDDIISTGGTMIAAAQQLLASGATRLVAACTHGVFAMDALAKLKEAGFAEVVSTDTLESAASRVTVAPVVAEALSRPAPDKPRARANPKARE